MLIMSFGSLLGGEEEHCLVLGCCEEDCCGKGTYWAEGIQECLGNRHSAGFTGTYFYPYEHGCVARSCCDELCCGETTYYSKELQSCVYGRTKECQPTTSSCVSTFSEFQNVASNAKAGDVIALCGNGVPIETESALVLDKPKMKLCCDSLVRGDCVLKSSGNDRNLLVTSTGVTLQDIVFLDGKSHLDGGNVAFIPKRYEDRGDLILNCEFRNGQSDRVGGNLYIDADYGGEVKMEKSLFVNGSAASGGGAAVLAEYCATEECVFQGNKGENNAGGLFVFGGGVIIKNSTFTENKVGDNGGGFAFAEGTDTSLVYVQESTFDRNVGGAGHIHIEDGEVYTQANDGSGNMAGDSDCEGFFYKNKRRCIGVSEEGNF